MVREISPVHGVPPSSSNDQSLQQALQEAQQWLNGPPPLTGPDQAAAQQLIQEIKSLQASGGTMKDLTNWYNSTFNNQQRPAGDLYWQFIGISQNGVNLFSSICNVQPPTETPTDKAMTKIYELMNEYSNDTSSPDYQMYSQLFDTLYTTFSSTSPFLLFQQNASSIVGGVNFKNFPGLSQDAIDAYASIFYPQ